MMENKKTNFISQKLHRKTSKTSLTVHQTNNKGIVSIQISCCSQISSNDHSFLCFGSSPTLNLVFRFSFIHSISCIVQNYPSQKEPGQNVFHKIFFFSIFFPIGCKRKKIYVAKIPTFCKPKHMNKNESFTFPPFLIGTYVSEVYFANAEQ